MFGGGGGGGLGEFLNNQDQHLREQVGEKCGCVCLVTVTEASIVR